ncbi:MAG: hypothetical protein OEV42_21035 [Deltaproteobacteria bacterium]|nr:hypothetical protein [Deltaproteobacteria bacterium]
MFKYILLITACLISFSQNVSAKALIYDEEKGVIYLNEEFINLKRYEEKRKISEEPKRKIYLIDVEANTSRTLIYSNRRVETYDISGKGHIAVMESWNEKVSSHIKRALIIYDIEGRQLKEILDVPRTTDSSDSFVWSPDGGMIAYVTGVPTLDEKYGPFRSTGIWIYNVNKDKTEKVGGGYGVNWSSHDGNLYMQFAYGATEFASIYDVNTGKTRQSGKKGLIFSDDGKYHIGKKYPESMGEDVRDYVYRSSTNEVHYEFSIEKAEWKGYAKFIYDSQFLLMWSDGRFYKVFDVETKKIIRKAKHALLGWNKDMTRAVVYEKGKIHIDEMLTGKRLMSLDLPGE